MDKKAKFNNALLQLTDYAIKNNNFVTTSDIKNYFKDIELSDSDFDAVKTYLKAQNFSVDIPLVSSPKDKKENSESDSKTIESEEELQFIQMYMDDMKKLPVISDDEIQELISKLLSGDTSIANQLTEAYLKHVADIASEFRNKGTNFGDLIQEGNMALMAAISEYSQNDGDFSEFINNRVRHALASTINDQINSDRIGQHLADKLNQLDNVTSNLSMKFGRTPEVSEIAEAMNMTEEETSNLLKISLDILSVNEDTKITDAPEGENIDNIDSNDDTSSGLTWNINK